MIYTSYFAKIRSLPESIEPISIALHPPKGFQGLQYPKLAPTRKILDKYRQDKDKSNYIQAYHDDVLNRLNPDDVVRELHLFLLLTDKRDIALICYEKPENFCHRHLVTDWLNKAGFKCLEWKGDF